MAKEYVGSGKEFGQYGAINIGIRFADLPHPMRRDISISLCQSGKSQISSGTLTQLRLTITRRRKEKMCRPNRTNTTTGCRSED